MLQPQPSMCAGYREVDLAFAILHGEKVANLADEGLQYDRNLVEGSFAITRGDPRHARSPRRCPDPADYTAGNEVFLLTMVRKRVAGRDVG